MGGKTVMVVLDTNKAVKILKWKVKEGMLVSSRQVIFIYDEALPEINDKPLKFKSTQVGTVRRILAKEEDIVYPGGFLLELEECQHPTVMKDMCAECGADLKKNEQFTTNASVPMVHSIPELKVSEEQAQIIGKADENRLLGDRKLVLLVDLDQTLIHTTNDNIPPNLKDVYHFRLFGHMSSWYHTRIRPRTHKFLEEISKYYELHICTFGARNYAHMIATFLDPDGKYFSHRILSRDECFNANSKTANLKALFPCGDNMVCIIDDREDVWNFAANLIHVKPYHFFKHTGDINAPPGLTKKENDEIDGFDFSDMNKQKEENSENFLEESNSEKNILSMPLKSNIETLGESTTDKDTEDENEKKIVPKISEETKNIEKVTGDLQLSEDDSDDTIVDLKGNINSTSISQKILTDKVDDVESFDYTAVGTAEKINTNEYDKETKNEVVVSPIIEFESDILKEEDKTLVNTENELTENCKENEKKIKDGYSEEKELLIDKKKEENSEDKETKATSKKLLVNNVTSNTEAPRAKEQKTKEGIPETDNESLIEVEDTDDYLLYLEDILKNIHSEYYKEFDLIQNSDKCSGIPDLKVVIPNVKKKVLKGCHLVFSGLVPSHVPLQQSRAYTVAVSLGAVVSPDISPGCTHLVAARPGTAKVNSSRRQKGITIVTPLWLWDCAERWEKLDEKMYTLGRGGTANRVPQPHREIRDCNFIHETQQYAPALRNRTPSGRFIDTINPLLTFSSEDMKIMDQEVDDLCKEDDDDESESEIDKKPSKIKTISKVPVTEDSSTTSSEDSLSGACHPKGWGEKKARKRKADTTTCTETEYDEESPSVKFRRGEPLPSDLDLGEDSQDTPGSDEPIDDVDDGEWNMMGAALEREFLSGE